MQILFASECRSFCCTDPVGPPNAQLCMLRDMSNPNLGSLQQSINCCTPVIRQTLPISDLASDDPKSRPCQCKNGA